jgi:hypothetical protein
LGPSEQRERREDDDRRAQKEKRKNRAKGIDVPPQSVLLFPEFD